MASFATMDFALPFSYTMCIIYWSVAAPMCGKFISVWEMTSWFNPFRELYVAELQTVKDI